MSWLLDRLREPAKRCNSSEPAQPSPDSVSRKCRCVQTLMSEQRSDFLTTKLGINPFNRHQTELKRSSFDLHKRGANFLTIT